MSQHDDPRAGPGTNTYPSPAPPTSPPENNGTHPPGGAYTYTNTQATRNLCAGVYLDENFQRRILDEIYNEPRRAVAPAAGADAASVALHARRARTLAMTESGLLCTITLLFLCTVPGATLAAAALLMAWQFHVSLIRLIADTVAYVRDRTSMHFPHLLSRYLLLGFAGIAISTAFVIVGVGQVLSSFSDSSNTFPSTPSRSSPVVDSDQPSNVFAVLMLGLGMSLATVGWFAAMRRLSIRRLRGGVGDTGLADTGKSRRIRVNQLGDVVNYSGYTPFVGFGHEIQTWQIALPLYPRSDDPGRRIEQDGPGFTVQSLVYAIHSGLYRYLVDHPGFKRLPGLVITDQAFVAGLDTRTPVHFVSELPRSGMPGDMALIKDDPTLPVRHYLKCQVSSWEGELVTTIFVTVAIQGETLYMEFASHVLPPTREEYHVFEDHHTSGVAVTLDVLRAIATLPLRIGRSPVVLLRQLRDAVRAVTRQADVPEELAGRRDNGARVSARELGTDLDAHHYFQQRDAVKYTMILQTQILEHTLNHLEQFIDVSELRQRKDNIVNNNIINQGPVYTASQTGHGHVGAMGHRAQTSATPKGR